MPTALKRPTSRVVEIKDQGAFVVTLRKDGVHIRARRKRKGVLLPYDFLAYRGLEFERYNLSSDQWVNPLATLRALGQKRIKRAR